MDKRTPFAHWLADQRGARSKAAVARGAGVSRTSLSRAERGERLLTPQTLGKVCRFYQVKLEDILPLMGEANVERLLAKEQHRG